MRSNLSPEDCFNKLRILLEIYNYHYVPKPRPLPPSVPPPLPPNQTEGFGHYINDTYLQKIKLDIAVRSLQMLNPPTLVELKSICDIYKLHNENLLNEKKKQ